MKKILILILAAVFSLLFITCDLLFEDTDTTKVYKENEVTGNFWARNYETEKFYQVDAQLLAENSRVKIWTEKRCGVSAATAKKIADEYAKNIYPKMMNTFGFQISDPKEGKLNTMEIAHYLITGKKKDAKLTILLLDIQDGYKTEDDPYVGGYFYPVDFFENDPAYPNIKSNELDMIYIDTYPSVPGSEDTYETLAHEMQHLMNFVTTLLVRSEGENLNLMDTWIDEGLSAAAQWVYSGKHPEDRWKYYNADPSGLIAKGNNFFMWDNHDDNPYANLDDYATVYLFFQYLRLQAGNPKNIYYDIHTSVHPDYQAVTKANNLNKNHKGNWQLLLRDWHAANYTNNTSGLYGYMNDPVLKDIKAKMYNGGTSAALFPGEGVYSRTNTAESVPFASGNIRYAGLGSLGTDPSDSTGFVSGARLTYNIDTDLDGSAVTGSTTGIAPSADISIAGGKSSLQVSINKFTGPFKVDAGYFSRRNVSKPENQTKNVFSKSRSRNAGKDNSIVKFDISTIERVYISE